MHDSRGIHSFDATFLGHIEFFPFVQKNGEFSSLAKEDVLLALRNAKQFVLKSFIEEGMSEKITVSSDNEEVDQLALVIKMVEAGLGWALLPKTFAHSEFSHYDIEPIPSSEMEQGFKFGFALWCPHSKQISEVKSSVLAVIKDNVERLLKRD